MNKTIIFFAAIFFLCSFFSEAKIIPAETLFKSAEVHQYKLSPNTSLFVNIANEVDRQELIVTNSQTMKSFSVAEIFYADKLFFTYLSWADERTIYAEYKSSEDGTVFRAFLHLTVDNNSVKAKFEKIETDGYMVDTLETKENKVLFAKRELSGRKSKYTLYQASFSDLAKNKLVPSAAYPYNLDNANHYNYNSDDDVLTATIFEQDETHYWLLDKNTKQWRKILVTKNYDYDFRPVGIINDNKLAVLSNKNSDLMSLYEYDIKEQVFGELIYQHSKYDLQDARIDTRNQRVDSVSYYDHGRKETKYFTYESEQLNKKLKAAFNNSQIVTVSKKEKSDRRIIHVFASNNSGEYYLVDTSTLVAELISSKYKDLNNYPLAKSEVYTVSTSDDQNVEVIFTKPNKDSNGVLLVMPHGGPIGVREYDAFDAEVQYLVSRGYSTLKVNFRGSKGFGKKFQQQGVGQFGKIIESDINDALNFIKTKYNFSHYCSMGSSYGGYSAMMLAISHPEQYACVVAKYGIYDLPLIFNQTNFDKQADRIKSIENVLGKMRSELWEVSPLYYLEKLSSPLLLMAGKKDRIAHFEQTNRVKFRLDQLEKKYKSVFYESAAHGHQTWFGDRHEMAITEQFIRESLKLGDLKGENSSEIRKLESLVIADGYDDNEFLAKKPKKAFDYYKISAALGSARAQFNVGSYYHRGQIVDFDLKQAESWYLKSSDNGFDKASYRLGELYEKGELKNLEKYYRMFAKADLQKSKVAYLEMAKAKCLGVGVELDVENCLNTLALTEKKNDTKYRHFEPERNRRDAIIKEIMSEHSFNEVSLDAFKLLVKKLFNVKVFNISINVKSEGMIKISNAKNTWYWEDGTVEEKGVATYDENLTYIPAIKGSKFGAVVNFKALDETNGHKNNRTVVHIRWVTPKHVKGTEGERITETFVSYPTLGSNSKYTYTLNKDWEVMEGEWKLEVRNIENKIIYEKKFYTKKVISN